MRIGSLFAGVGGIELGLEWAGVGHTVWQVERDPYCQRVLKRHWPDAQLFDDVTTAGYGASHLAPVDVICGGFPCQDISNAGLRAGIDGEKSGLWRYFARIIGLVRPGFVVIENVSALVNRGLGRVLADLAGMGFDAEWHRLGASDVGAHHRRHRLFIIAWRPLAIARGGRCSSAPGGEVQLSRRSEAVGAGAAANPDGESGHVERKLVDRQHADGSAQANLGRDGEGGYVADALCDADHEGEPGLRVNAEVAGMRSRPGRWLPEPIVGRVADGVPDRVDRVRALGNAVVPQCAEVIGWRLLEIARGLQQ